MKVCAGIVLYNPDVVRLKESIDRIRPQVTQLVFVDNASDNIEELQGSFADDKYVWIKNDSNLGIAKALNQLVEFSDKNGYQWILTLDQDSICGDDLVYKLLDNAIIEEKTALASPLILDRGIVADKINTDDPYVKNEEVKMCITSGCLTNVKAIIDIGGFNEWLFIYDVDREICIRLLRAGYRLIRVNSARLYHEHGLKTVSRRFLLKKVVYRNYTPFSVYYMTRNLVYMLRKYGSEYSPRPFFRWVRLYFAFCVKFIFEPDRIQRLKAFRKGLRDGYATNI